MLEVLQAAHWSYLVDSEWKERGGIMLCAPPGALKTTALTSLDVHHDTLILSDINVNTMTRLIDDIGCGRYHTLVFPEFEKIYQRNPQTSLNLEGHIKAMVEEGFRIPSFVDQRAPGAPAKCLVIGAITPSCIRRHLERWIDNGFARRFLWITYNFDTSVITDAIDDWKKADLTTDVILSMKNKKIPYILTPGESHKLRSMVKHQRGQETPFVLLKKIACVLKQRDLLMKESRTMAIMTDFAESLRPNGTQLTL